MYSPSAECREVMLAIHALLGQIHSRLDILCSPVTYLLEDACQHMQPAAADSITDIAALHSIHGQHVGQQARREATHQHRSVALHAATEVASNAAQTGPSATTAEQQSTSRTKDASHTPASTKYSKPQPLINIPSTAISIADGKHMPEIFQQLSINMEELAKSVAAITGATEHMTEPMLCALEPSFSWQLATRSPSTNVDHKPGSTSFGNDLEPQQQLQLTSAVPAVVFDTGSTETDLPAAAADTSDPAVGDTKDITASSSSCDVPLPSHSPISSSARVSRNGSNLCSNNDLKDRCGTTAAAAGAAAYSTPLVMYQPDNVEPSTAGSAAVDGFLMTGYRYTNSTGQCFRVAETALAQPMQVSAETTKGVASLPDSDQISASSGEIDQVSALGFDTRHMAGLAVATQAEAAVTGHEPPTPPAAQVTDTPQAAALVPEAFGAKIRSCCSSMPLSSTQQSSTEQLSTCNSSKDITSKSIEHRGSRATATAAEPALQTPAKVCVPRIPAAVSAAAGTGCNSNSSSDNMALLQDSAAGPLQLSRMAVAARRLLKRRQVRARPLGWQQSAAVGAAAPVQSVQSHSSSRNALAGATAAQSSATVDSRDLSDVITAGWWTENTNAADKCHNSKTHQDQVTADQLPCSGTASDQPSNSSSSSSSGSRQQLAQKQLSRDCPSSCSRGRGSLVEAAAALVLAGSSVKKAAAAAAAAARSAEVPVTVLSSPECGEGCDDPARSSSSVQNQLMSTAQLMIVSILATPEKCVQLRVSECERNQRSNKARRGDKLLQWQQQRQQQQQQWPARPKRRHLESLSVNSSDKPLQPWQPQQQEQQKCHQQQQQRLGVLKSSRALSAGHQAAASANIKVQKGAADGRNSAAGKSVSNCRKDQHHQQPQHQRLSTAAGLPCSAKAAASPAVHVTGTNSRTVDSDSSSNVGSSPHSNLRKPLDVAAASNGINASWVQGRWTGSPNMLDRARKLGLATSVDGSHCGLADVGTRLSACGL